MRLIYLILALVLWLAWPALAQETPSPSPTPGELPPLVLPDMPDIPPEPDEDGGPAMPPDEPAEAIPPPPPPLPMPKGPAVVKADLVDGPPRLFEILYDGKLVGFSTFDVRGQMGLAGEQFYILESKGRIKLGVGSVPDTLFISKLLVDRKTLAPSFFQCDQGSKAGQVDFGLNCVYTDTMVAQTNRAGKITQEHYFEYPKGEVPRLLFNNLWGALDTFPEHYWLLIRSAVNGGVVRAYDPILRGSGDVVVYSPKTEKVKWAGQDVVTRVYPITDLKGTLLARVRVLDKNLEVLSVEEVGTGLVMRRTNDVKVIERVSSTRGLDLWPFKVRPSNVFFPDPEKLTALEAEVELWLRGGQFADHRIPGYRQYFTGELKEGYMKGRVVVRSAPIELDRKTAFPLKEALTDELKAYTRPGPGVESDYPAIINKAMELTWKSENTFQAARRLNNYVYSEVEEGVSLPSARYALESGVGNPESKALALVALARAGGLPSRRVGGLLFRDGSFVPHYWVEVYLGSSEGWAPFDPTSGEAGHVGATHIALWESGDVQKLDIKVVSYAPRAPSRVSFFNSELSWPVGEERVYSIVKDGQKIGQEVAGIRELIVTGDKEGYLFEANAELLNEEQKPKYTADSKLLVDPRGLPLEFRLSTSESGKPGTEQSFAFANDVARQERKEKGGNTVVREVPFSQGTYLTDQRFLSQWALVVGQTPRPEAGKTYQAGDKYTFHVFVPEDLRTREMVLEIKGEETLVLADGSETTVWRLESDGGMAFFLNDKNQVIKISIPQQNLDLVLQETRFKLQ
ncbi:MAG: transglutaminase domain-containing protein [Candidatus Eremiobacterota bacterium]